MNSSQAGLRQAMEMVDDDAASVAKATAEQPWRNELNGETPEDHLVDRLQHGDPLVRMRALAQLGRRESSLARQALLSALSDPSPQMRSTAVRLLVERSEPDAPQLLARMVREDPEREIRRDALLAFQSFPPGSPFLPLIAQQRVSAEVPMSEAAKEVLRHYGHEYRSAYRDLLLRHFVSTDPEQRKRAAEVLVDEFLGDSRAEPIMLRAARAGDLQIAAIAYEALLRNPGRRDIDIAVRAIDQCGNLDMAQAMLNSGDRRLEAAARSWAAGQRL